MKDTVSPFERLRATVFKGTRPQKSAYLILGTPAFQLIIWGVKMHPVRDSRSLSRRRAASRRMKNITAQLLCRVSGGFECSRGFQPTGHVDNVSPSRQRRSNSGVADATAGLFARLPWVETHG